MHDSHGLDAASSFHSPVRIRARSSFTPASAPPSRKIGDSGSGHAWPPTANPAIVSCWPHSSLTHASANQSASCLLVLDLRSLHRHRFCTQQQSPIPNAKLSATANVLAGGRAIDPLLINTQGGTDPSWSLCTIALSLESHNPK